MEIDIYSPEKDGYEVKHCFDGWRVAYLRYAEKFDDITYLERHLETDEVFVLLQGSASLLLGENAECTEMETGKIYNVRKGIWHNIKVSKDALVLIVENKDTCKDNSEYVRNQKKE
ncbi:MAG: hypothetical protein PUE13_06645 [Clostridiales bacterium]|nr:hypothetical protein [Clostridiales bacterium]